MVEVLSNETVPYAAPIVLRDHMAVDLLMNLDAARRLAPFMRRDHSLGSAAAELEMPASSLAYWVGRFLKAGLITVVRREPRAGKAIPIYRAASDEFQIPLEAMPAGVRDEFLNGGRRHMFEEFTKAVDEIAQKYLRGGLRVRCHPERGVELNFLDSDGPLPVSVTEAWASVALTDDEAREIQATLDALSAKINTNAEGPGRRQYVMVLGLAPKPRR